jgi:hexosaminidase
MDALKDPLLKVIPEDLIVQPDGELSLEAYVLTIEQKTVTIRSSSQRGRYNALLTLTQLVLSSQEEGKIHCCTIEDEPLFLNRAVMLDVSRDRVYKMDYLKQMIRRFVLLKYNQIQLYTEHTFAYKGHEEVWRDASPFTPSEIRELDLYCLDRGMELVPNQNSFGHMERWLKHSKYHSLAETAQGFTDSWGVFHPVSTTLYPGCDESLELVKDLYDQLLPCFSSRQFNIGCDETFDLGLGRSQDLVKEKGEGRVYLDFLIKLTNEATSRGFTVQFWADIVLNYPELVPEIPEDLIAVNWGYERDHPFEKETGVLKDAGLDFYVCTGTSSWHSLAGRWENALENIRNGAYWAEENGALGYMVTDWGDNGHWQQPLVSWPGFLMASQAAWGGASSMEEMEESTWTSALSTFLFRDSSGRSARVLRKLASLYLENPVSLHNGSLFNYLLMDPFYPFVRDQYEKCRCAGLGRAGEILDECSRLLSDVESTGSVIFREELEMTLSLCRMGVRLSTILFDTGGVDWEKIPAEERMSLNKQLTALGHQFSRSWALSSRPGGLDDSLIKLLSWKERLSS